MIADLAVLGDMQISQAYQNPDVAMYILDDDGLVLLEVPFVESQSDVNEEIEAINTRLDVFVRDDGILKSEFYGLNFMSETRRALMMAEAKEGQFVINIIGNSWVANEWNLPRRLTQVCKTDSVMQAPDLLVTTVTLPIQDVHFSRFNRERGLRRLLRHPQLQTSARLAHRGSPLPQVPLWHSSL